MHHLGAKFGIFCEIRKEIADISFAEDRKNQNRWRYEQNSNDAAHGWGTGAQRMQLREKGDRQASGEGKDNDGSGWSAQWYWTTTYCD